MKTTRRRIKERIQRKLFTQDWFHKMLPKLSTDILCLLLCHQHRDSLLFYEIHNREWTNLKRSSKKKRIQKTVRYHTHIQNFISIKKIVKYWGYCKHRNESWNAISDRFGNSSIRRRFIFRLGEIMTLRANLGKTSYKPIICNHCSFHHALASI